MEEESWRRNHGAGIIEQTHEGGIMENESERNHGGRNMEEESWSRNHGGGIMEKESGRRNHGGGIMGEILIEAVIRED